MQLKLGYTKDLIQCWADAWGVENIAVSFSGGKDSLVLKHIVRGLYPNVKAVFSHTGLEYSEIVSLVKNSDNVDIVRPPVPFHEVIKKHGWPVISKDISRFVSDCRNASERNKKTVNLRLTGVTSTGGTCKSKMLPKKWRFLIDAPFDISDKCCECLKKKPLEKYYKKTGLRPMLGVMREESNRRDKMIKKYGCNAYDLKQPLSYPLANWTTEDVWKYIRENKLEYASVYDKGEARTGCVFCMFGIMYDQERFLRLKKISPKQHEYIIDGLGADKVLDFIGIKY